MAKREVIADALMRAPGTNKELSERLGIPIPSLSSITSVMFKRGEVGRTEVGRTLANVPIYQYHTALKAAPAEKKEKPLATKKRVRGLKSEVSSIEGFISELAGAIAQSLVVQIKQRLLNELEVLKPEKPHLAADPDSVLQTISEAISAHDKVPAVTKLRLPIVGVVGLLPIQAGEISAEFSECLDLRFWDSGKGLGTLRSMAASCEVVFLHTRHLSHKVDETLKSAGANIRRITGGTSNMKSALTDYFVEKT